MNLREALRYLGAPLRDPSALLATLFFWLLGWIAVKAGVLGLWLLLILLPAFVSYLVLMVESCAMKRAAPVVAMEHFNPADAGWRLFPVVLVGFFVLSYTAVAEQSTVAADAVLLAAALLTPLSLSLLAITHSPLSSLNPIAAAGLLQRLGPRYLWAPGYAVVGAGVIRSLCANGMPDFLVIAAVLYWLTSLCALAGGVLATVDLRPDIDIDEAVPPEPAVIALHLQRRRQAALNHAYGLISRGNLDGGFAHLDEFAAANEQPLVEERWFLDAMLGWENRATALFFAQRHLGHLLDDGYDVEAMKLIARCLRENADFRPHAADRERALAAARRLGNRDMELALSR